MDASFVYKHIFNYFVNKKIKFVYAKFQFLNRKPSHFDVKSLTFAKAFFFQKALNSIQNVNQPLIYQPHAFFL